MNDSTENVFEMFWDCSACGTSKLLGVTHRHCPHCGSPQDPTARYFPADSEKIAVENHQLVGRDLICSACGSANARIANNCLGCGRALDAQAQAKVRDDVLTDEGVEFSGQSLAALKSAEQAAKQTLQHSPAVWRKGKWAVGTSTVGGVAALVLWNTPVELSAVSHEWSRSIVVERYGPVQDAAWCDRLPAGADITSRSSKVREHRNVPDGQQCSDRRIDNGDGSYSEKRECKTKYRKEPVYDDWCRYTELRWSRARTAKAAGSGTAIEPHWPTVTLGNTGVCIGCERQGKRSERYTLTFENTDGERYSCDFGQPRWRQISVGSQFVGNVGALNNLDCNSLENKQAATAPN